MRKIYSAILIIATIGATSVNAADVEINTWTTLEKPGNGHFGNPLVWCPVRKQLLHYTAYDVRAFDAAKGTWSKDYSWSGEKGFGLPGHNNNKGVTYKGTGLMTPKGLPAPATTVGGCTWDSKRKQMLMVTHGLMAAYDPTTKKWSEIKCETELYGKKMPGAPKVYGAGVCYDPINDELLMFGHWGGRNYDLREITGEYSAFMGTMIYSFKTRTWTRPGEALADPKTAVKRATLLSQLKKRSEVLDKLYIARSRTALVAGSKALRELRAQLDGPLRVEPPPRCGIQPVYNPATRSIVLFGGMGALRRTDLKMPRGKGGGPGAYNDTWAYDCTKRRWREIPCKSRPPATINPKIIFDPVSRKMILVTAVCDWGGGKAKLSLWTLDVARGEWLACGTQPAPDNLIPRTNWTGWGIPTFELGLDPDRKLLLLVGKTGSRRTLKTINYALHLDVAALTTQPAPAWTAPPPVKPVVILPDNPAWIAKLKSLPANTWTRANPKGGKTPRRDWGNAACDPIRGNVYYFGGGHSTYQGRDVAIYCVGANRWIHGAAGYNDHLPAVGWGGSNIDFWGSPPASHQRNSYVALDGRLYKSFGTGTMRSQYANPLMAKKGPRWSLFYDIDRGGLWRNPKIAEVTWGEGIKGTYAGVHLAHPDGKIMGFGGQLEPYNGRFCRGVVHFASHDIYKNTLTVKNIKPPFPGVVLEARPFCLMADQGKEGRIFFYEYAKGGGHATWHYDIAENVFTNLNPKRQPPPGEVGTVVYIPDQKAIFAVINRSQQWVYSLEKNTWAPMPTGKKKFAGPYAQTVYSIQYGVLVDLPGTEIMRPDINKMSWR